MTPIYINRQKTNRKSLVVFFMTPTDKVCGLTWNYLNIAELSWRDDMKGLHKDTTNTAGMVLLTLGAMKSTLCAYSDKHSLSSRGREREKTWERGENFGCTTPGLVVEGTSSPPSELDSSSSSSRSCCGVHAITRGCAGPACVIGFLHSGAGTSEQSSWMPPGLASPEIPESPDLSWLLRGACCCRTCNMNK